MKKTFFVGLFVLAFCVCSCAKQETVSKTEFIIGTICSIQVPKTKNAETVLAKCFDELRRLELVFSARDEGSELFALNAAEAGASVAVSPELYELLLQAQDLARKTNYAFEPAIGSLVELWGIGFDAERVPEPERIAELLEFSSSAFLTLKNGRVRRESEYTQIDLGAIAKGFLADHIAKLLKDEGVESAIVNFGGNIFALGKKFFSDKAWSIGLRDPAGAFDAVKTVVQVEDKSVVTSGIYERFFLQDGKRYHHVLDPSTGYPVENELASVSIVAQSSCVADALATACLVLGYEKSLEVLAGFEDVEAVFFMKDGSMVATNETYLVGF